MENMGIHCFCLFILAYKEGRRHGGHGYTPGRIMDSPWYTPFSTCLFWSIKRAGDMENMGIHCFYLFILVYNEIWRHGEHG